MCTDCKSLQSHMPPCTALHTETHSTCRVHHQQLPVARGFTVRAVVPALLGLQHSTRRGSRCLRLKPSRWPKLMHCQPASGNNQHIQQRPCQGLHQLTTATVAPSSNSRSASLMAAEGGVGDAAKVNSQQHSNAEQGRPGQGKGGSSKNSPQQCAMLVVGWWAM